MWATIYGKTKVVHELISVGANVNLQNYEGKTALHLAVERQDLELIQYLCENGANVNIEDLEGIRPCHQATILGNQQLLSTLSKYGAYLAAVDDAGDSILHLAVREGKSEMLEFILQFFIQSIDVNSQNNDMETPLDLAVELDEKEIVRMLKPIAEKVEETRIKRKYEFEEPSFNLSFEKKEAPFHKHAKLDSIYWGCTQLIPTQL